MAYLLSHSWPFGLENALDEQTDLAMRLWARPCLFEQLLPGPSHSSVALGPALPRCQSACYNAAGSWNSNRAMVPLLTG